jgi:NAD(P)-dependent dehydrogenase (short-subunit alcohol dehydrogenase family)
LTLARQGYDVVALDAPKGLTTLPYETASEADLEQTCALVREAGARAVAVVGDVRNTSDIELAVQVAKEDFGGLDVVIANAGICTFAPFDDITDEQWDEMQAVNLGGVFKTLRAALPTMREQGSGRLLATSSMAGRGGSPNIGHYAAMKAGVISLVKTLALELGTSGITVNCLCPTTTDTPMVHNRPMYGLFAPDIDDPTPETVRHRYEAMNPMRVAWLDPQEIADVMAFLVSDAGRHISGAVFEISAGGSGSQL